MCQQGESYSSRVSNPLSRQLLSCMPQWWGKIECDGVHKCESKMPCMFLETCLSKDILESRWTPKFLIDDWSLMDEPATEMDLMDSAKALRGSNHGLKKAMASDLDGLRWRPLFRSQLWTLWVRNSIEATWCTSMEALYTAGCHRHIDERTPGFWQVGIYYIGNRWYEWMNWYFIAI